MLTTISSEMIGANLKRLIKESKYRTQENFAYAFGCDPRTLRRWLKDGIDSICDINRCATLLEVDVKALLF